ncbi:MAG: class I SAM-dependent methyltransferase, partial [Candidatus Omnitrophota bacterium]
MKIITPEIIQTLINDFSHGAGTDYNPCSQMGSQRESFADLGYGWVYFAMARAFDARSALVIGSGRGYSAACIGLALDAKEDSQIVLVDPGYTGWDVDGKTTDHADGLWRAGDGALSHFRDKLDIHNISLQPLRSDEAFEGFIRLRRRFDLIVIDGDHGYAQSLRDLKNGLEVLTDNGIIIAHDAYCPEWAGVAAAIESLVLEDPSLDRITIPNRPGLAIIQRRPSTICYRIATVPENEIINGWRRQA